jgi:hypothetical protein
MELIYTTKLKTTPQLLSMWLYKLKLDESKSKHVNLAHQNGFGLAFLHNLLRLMKSTTKPHICWRRKIINLIWLLLSQPYFGQVWGWSPTLGKSEDLESSGTPECLGFDSKAQNNRIEVFLVSLERSWSVNIENGLALAIWTSVAQVVGKRRAGSQTGNLTPDH